MQSSIETISRLFGERSVHFFVLFVLFVSAGCQSSGDQNYTSSTDPAVTATSQVAAGRYVAIIGGCNDCHTEGYLQTEGNIPEEDWLAGSALGWRGPWGTTYPPNLRLTVQSISEDAFFDILRTRKALPPMPWMNVNQMSEQDARALYQYLRSLGPKGDAAPSAVPPDQEPQTPYLLLEPLNLPPAAQNP